MSEDLGWRADPMILQVDADAQEEFNSEWALRFSKALANPRHLDLLRDLWMVAYSSGFTKGFDTAARLIGVNLSDFPPTPPNGDRPDPDRDDLDGGEDDGDGPS